MGVVKGTRLSEVTLEKVLDVFKSRQPESKISIIKLIGVLKGKHHCKAKCHCGTHFDVAIYSLWSARTKSCGCLNYKHSTHGKSKERIYVCWIGMKARSKGRGKCNIYKPWITSFEEFEAWSLSNGYSSDLILCRNKDTGDYTPGNCRWDTRANNTVEGCAYTWRIITPSGESLNIYNLRSFCDKHNLQSGSMYSVAAGRHVHYKGYKCTKLFKGERDEDIIGKNQ